MAKPKVDYEHGSSQPMASIAPRNSPKAALVLKEIDESVEAKQRLGRDCLEDIVAVADAITISLRSGGKVVLFGNGGSAADAQHIAAEFVGKFATERPALNSIALTTNTSILTAIGNDFGFDEVFSRQVAAQVSAGDVVMGISTSGRSKNVIKGVQKARESGAKTVALTGSNGGELARLCDYRITVPSTNTQRIQECHILVGHILCMLVETDLAGSSAVRRPS